MDRNQCPRCVGFRSQDRSLRGRNFPRRAFFKTFLRREYRHVMLALILNLSHSPASERSVRHHALRSRLDDFVTFVSFDFLKQRADFVFRAFEDLREPSLVHHKCAGDVRGFIVGARHRENLGELSAGSICRHETSAAINEPEDGFRFWSCGCTGHAVLSRYAFNRSAMPEFFTFPSKIPSAKSFGVSAKNCGASIYNGFATERNSRCSGACLFVNNLATTGVPDRRLSGGHKKVCGRLCAATDPIQFHRLRSADFMRPWQRRAAPSRSSSRFAKRFIEFIARNKCRLQPRCIRVEGASIRAPHLVQILRTYLICN